MLTTAINHWNKLQDYRNERLRCKNYTYGDQWKDIVNADGRRITEEQYLREQGSAPLKNNLIRKNVRNIIGVFRNNYALPSVSDLAPGLADKGELASLYAHAVKANCLSEIYSRVLEEYLIGGLAVVKKKITTLKEGGVATLTVRPESFFFDTDSIDPRGRDIDIIGEIHTLKGREMKRHFPRIAKRFEADDDTPCRVVECWSRDADGWRFQYIDADGETLMEGRSPLPGATHPYVMKAYPFIDGEIHSFVADCIDQQRYIS